MNDWTHTVRIRVSRRFDGWVSANVIVAVAQGRCVDGAPTPRLPSCAGERHRSPLMSANRRLMEPRETGVHNDGAAVNEEHETRRDTTT